MLSITESATLWMYSLLGINVAALAGCAYVGIVRYRRRKKDAQAINTAIVEYFRKSGVAVSVNSVSLQNNQRFTAFIESEPMKRFRLSHIIEMTLRDHIVKTCGLELDKIYWRFPIKDAPKSGNGKDGEAATGVDDYIHEGLVPYRDLPKVDVNEIPWEQFEEVSTVADADKP